MPAACATCPSPVVAMPWRANTRRAAFRITALCSVASTIFGIVPGPRLFSTVVSKKSRGKRRAGESLMGSVLGGAGRGSRRVLR